MKRLSELYAPKAPQEKAFVDANKPQPVMKKAGKVTDDDKMFKATNVKTFKRASNRFGYDPDADEKVYDGGNAVDVNVERPETGIAPYTVKIGESEVDKKLGKKLENAGFFGRVKKDEPKMKININREHAKAAHKADTDYKKKTNEDIERIDELSPKTLKSYRKKASGTGPRSAWGLSQRGEKEEDKSMSTDGYKYPEKQERHQKAASKLYNKSANREAGTVLASRKLGDRILQRSYPKIMAKEEAEHLDELSPQTLKSYAKKADSLSPRSVYGLMHTGQNAYQNGETEEAKKRFRKANKRNAAYYMAQRKINQSVKEDDLDETLGKNASASDYVEDFVHSKNSKFSGDSKKERIKRALGAYYGHKNEDINEVSDDDAIEALFDMIELMMGDE